ncbi:MAG: efflux RND transporter periplasmic adaptor subunit [Chloroflexi bacterium]|nr:efflux RND transporter periplasmic adaptor subunit [Chloroflexota bacterium]
MGSIWAAIRSLKVFQIAGIAALLATVGIGSWFGYNAFTGGNGSGLAVNEQIVPVTRGDLVSTVSVNGSLTFPERESLSFSTAGTVASLAITQGQRVRAGQELARLDAATIANLERAVAQARVDVKDAEDALTTARTPDAVKLAQARVAVDTAQATLDKLLVPGGLTLAQSESAVANARLALQQAEQAKQDFLDGSSASDFLSALQTAETALKNAVDALSVTQTSWDTKLSTAKTSRDSALTAYRDGFARYLGLNISSQASPSDPASILKTHGVDLTKIFGGSGPRLSDGVIPADDLSTSWNERTVYLWSAFYPGTVLATCDSSTLPTGTICVSRELDGLWTPYQSARDSLVSQENQAATAIATAQAAADKAKTARDDASAAYERASQGPDAVELAVKDQDITVAKAKLDDAIAAMEDLKGDPDPLQFALKKAELDSAKTALTKLEGGDPLQITLRESALAAARAALDTAQARLAGAVIKAPWDGEINSVEVSTGAAVTAATPVIEIVDPTRVQLDGSLDEIDVLFVQEGAAAQVTLDALAGQVVQGTVQEISTQGVNQSGVVTFPVTIEVTAPQGVQLREGLSATANIVLNQQSSVLLIPSQSVGGSFAEPVVRVLTGSNVSTRRVTLGNTDGFWVEVKDGLAEGERVVVAGQQTTTTGQQGGFRIGGPGGSTTIIGGGPLGGVQQFERAGGQGGQRTGNQGQGGQRTGQGQQTGGTR